jgi:hypothetical protein
MLRINQYSPLRGSSYVPLPKVLANKKAIINIKNNDDKYFLWSVLAALHPADDHVDRVSKYTQYENEFDYAFKDIEFPVKLSDISKFEKRTNISINVYFFNDAKKCVAPLVITKEEKLQHIYLLYLKESNIDHYCLVKDLSRLVSSQITKHGKMSYICRMCLNSFFF